jgi:hypothetical protein
MHAKAAFILTVSKSDHGQKDAPFSSYAAPLARQIFDYIVEKCIILELKWHLFAFVIGTVTEK